VRSVRNSSFAPIFLGTKKHYGSTDFKFCKMIISLNEVVGRNYLSSDNLILKENVHWKLQWILGNPFPKRTVQIETVKYKGRLT